MPKPHLLMVGNLILNTAIAVGCANGHNPPTDQVAVYREEAKELRTAAQYYDGEAQRSVQEAGQDTKRAQRYRDFAEQASKEAMEADRHADEYQR